MHYRAEEYDDGGVEVGGGGEEKNGGCLLKEVRA